MRGKHTRTGALKSRKDEFMEPDPLVERLFEYAVRLVEANIRAGQFLNSRDLPIYVHDQMCVTYDALMKVWVSVNETDELH